MAKMSTNDRLVICAQTEAIRYGYSGTYPMMLFVLRENIPAFAGGAYTDSMLIMGIVLLLVGVLLGYFAIKNKRTHAELTAKTAVPLGQAPVDGQVELSTVAAGDTITSPISQSPCVWWSYSSTEYYPEEEHDEATHRTSWREGSRSGPSQMSSEMLSVTDPTDASVVALVHIAAAQHDHFDSQRQFQQQGSNFGEGNLLGNAIGTAIGGGLSVGIGSGSGHGGYAGRFGIEHTEQIVREGQSLYVAGHLASGHIDKQDGPLVISTRGEAAFEQSLKTKGVWQRVATAVLVVAGVALIIAQLVS